MKFEGYSFTQIIQATIDYYGPLRGYRYHKDIAYALCISPSTFSRKFKNPNQFTMDEFFTIMRILCVDKAQVEKIISTIMKWTNY